MAKALGLDYGTKRVGVAVSDESRTLAREIGIWPAGDFFLQLKNYLSENSDIDQIVVGLPLNMAGGDSKKTEEARKFASRIARESGIPTALSDERLTSSMARNLPGGSIRIDALAAQIILQSYLDQQKNNE
jgi:putative Holliday junction resolvase